MISVDRGFTDIIRIDRSFKIISMDRTVVIKSASLFSVALEKAESAVHRENNGSGRNGQRRRFWSFHGQIYTPADPLFSSTPFKWPHFRG